MASKRAKIAISMDAELLVAVERLRLVTGESRSAVMARALSMLTQAEAHRAKVARYIAAYREQPETPAAVAAARAEARVRLAELPWDDT